MIPTLCKTLNKLLKVKDTRRFGLLTVALSFACLKALGAWADSPLAAGEKKQVS